MRGRRHVSARFSLGVGVGVSIGIGMAISIGIDISVSVSVSMSINILVGIVVKIASNGEEPHAILHRSERTTQKSVPSASGQGCHDSMDTNVDVTRRR